MTSAERRDEIKAEFESLHGDWDESWEAVHELDPEFLHAFARFHAVPARKGDLEPKVQEFVRIVVDANATHLYTRDVRGHIRRALDAGATPAEVMEVLECAATVGIHAMNVGVPVLVDVMEELGLREGPAPLDEYQERLKAEFTENRGYWNPTWDEMLELDPEAFEAYTDFSSVPWKNGALDPKIKEFLYIAFDTAATHLYTTGLRLHIVNAIGYGATPREILAVMEIASTIGMQTVREAAPLLVEEARRSAER